jgi:protein-disulfide isomerase
MNLKTIVIFVAVTLGVLLGVGGLLYQFGAAADKPIEGVAGEKNHALGSGKIVVTEFSDFQCPACQSVQEPLKQILKKYEGKVTLVYRHFPLVSIHKNAMVAAQASEAAYLQGKFWELHDKLFAQQREWEFLPDPKEKFGEYASALGLDKDKFMADIDNQAAKDAVSVDSLDATRFRLSGTPTFFVNGVKTEFPQIETKLSSLVK